MVDPDRLDELVGGSSKESKPKKKSKTSKSTDKKKSKTKRDKIESLKGGSSKSVKSTGGGNGTEDVKRLLFCLGNMDAYTRVVAEKEFSAFNQSQSVIKEEFARDVSGEIVNFLGVFNVRDVCDNYGYSWQNILQTSIDKQDLLGETLRTNSGDPNKGEIKDLLDCIANVLLFVEGNLREKQEKDNKTQRDATIESVSENLYDRYTTMVGRAGVQNIAERNGFDWQDDILTGVLSDQDFESKIKE